jgi:hypothetical protein
MSGKMNQIDFKDLSWPKGLNLETLTQVMNDDDLKKLIAANMGSTRLKRRIILPSRKCLKKILCWYYWRKVESGEASWDEIKNDLRQEFQTLKSIGMSKEKVKKLWAQRQKEIANEKLNASPSSGYISRSSSMSLGELAG